MSQGPLWLLRRRKNKAFHTGCLYSLLTSLDEFDFLASIFHPVFDDLVVGDPYFFFPPTVFCLFYFAFWWLSCLVFFLCMYAFLFLIFPALWSRVSRLCMYVCMYCPGYCVCRNWLSFYVMLTFSSFLTFIYLLIFFVIHLIYHFINLFYQIIYSTIFSAILSNIFLTFVNPFFISRFLSQFVPVGIVNRDFSLLLHYFRFCIVDQLIHISMLHFVLSLTHVSPVYVVVT